MTKVKVEKLKDATQKKNLYQTTPAGGERNEGPPFEGGALEGYINKRNYYPPKKNSIKKYPAGGDTCSRGEKGPLKNMKSRQPKFQCNFPKKNSVMRPFFRPLTNPNTSIPKKNRPGDTLLGVAQTLTQKFIYYDFGFIKKKSRGREPAGRIYL